MSKRSLKNKNQSRNQWVLSRELKIMRLIKRMQKSLDKALEREKDTGVRLMSTLFVNEPLPANIESRESVQKRWDEFIKNHGDELKLLRDMEENQE